MGSDVISQDFMSRVRKVMTYTESDGRQTVKQKVMDSFTATLIRVIDFKELYEAWESQCRSTVESMQKKDLELRKTKTYSESAQISTETADMEQIDWIERVPKILCLQLNRLSYSEAIGMIKHKHKVTFDKQIFVDRFLLQNAESSQKISKTVAVLRTQIKQLE
jgi:hypothetical protein